LEDQQEATVPDSQIVGDANPTRRVDTGGAKADSDEESGEQPTSQRDELDSALKKSRG
jgi:hypothetical protein